MTSFMISSTSIKTSYVHRHDAICDLVRPETTESSSASSIDTGGIFSQLGSILQAVAPFLYRPSQSTVRQVGLVNTHNVTNITHIHRRDDDEEEPDSRSEERMGTAVAVGTGIVGMVFALVGASYLGKMSDTLFDAWVSKSNLEQTHDSDENNRAFKATLIQIDSTIIQIGAIKSGLLLIGVGAAVTAVFAAFKRSKKLGVNSAMVALSVVVTWLFCQARVFNLAKRCENELRELGQLRWPSDLPEDEPPGFSTVFYPSAPPALLDFLKLSESLDSFLFGSEREWD